MGLLVLIGLTTAIPGHRLAAVALRRHEATLLTGPPWARAIVIAGGPLAAYLVAVGLLFVVFVRSDDRGPTTHVEITRVLPDGPAARAGLEVGDHLARVGETTVEPGAGVAGVTDILQAQPSPVELTVVRDGRTRAFTVHLADDGRIGVLLSAATQPVPRGPGRAASMAVVAPWEHARKLVEHLFGRSDAVLQGPVQIVTAMRDRAPSSLDRWLTAIGLASGTFAFLYLLPLPGLAGGRLLLLGFSGLTGRTISPAVERSIHRRGLIVVVALFMLLIGILTVLDLQALRP